MIATNWLKEKLARKVPCVGTWNTLGSPLATEVLGRAGLDFQIIDFEHGGLSFDRLAANVNACESQQCSPIVRIPQLSPWMALQALDLGAHGLIVPHIESAEDARTLVRMCKYAPVGERGYSPFTKAGGFTNQGNADYAARANAFTLLGIVVESIAGLHQLDEILKVPEIDVVYFGAYDLSQSVGEPGRVRSEKIVDILKKGVAQVNAAGKTAGGYVAQNWEDVEWLLEMGMRFVTYEVDASILYTPVREITSRLKGDTHA